MVNAPIEILQTDSGDADAFAARVASILHGVIGVQGIRRVAVVKVDNWFSQRWLRFRGKISGALGVHDGDEPALVPPFTPNRIVAERFFAIDAAGRWTETTPDGPVHVAQTSEDNQRRWLTRLFPDTALFWWSAQSASNGRGSLMAYLPSGGAHVGWYLECSADKDWHETAFKNITPREVARLVGLEPA